MNEKNKITIRKKDGFNGQKAIVLPKPIIKTCEQNSLTRNLHITDIGFYPKAKFHYRERENGSRQNILIYCTDGLGWADINDRKLKIKQGEYIIIPQNVKHKYGADDQHPWSIYWVHFKGEDTSLLIDILKGSKDNFFKPVSYSEKRLDLFNNIYNTLETGYSTDNLVYVNQMIRGFLASFCYPLLYNVPGKNNDNPIEKVIQYMQENTHKQLTLSELSALVHISTSHFSALFKRKTGYPPLEYFIHLKIQKACQYLEFTDMHVKELSYSLGFNDPFYFSRLFSKYMTMPPLEYRKKKRFK